MSTFKQSFAWWSFANKAGDPFELIKESAKLGYKGVEMVDEKYWSAIHDAGMCVATTGGHQSLSDGLNKRENHTRIEDELCKKLDVAQKNKIPCLIVFSGNRTWGKSPTSVWQA